MREVDCGRKGIFSLLTARRLEFPQKETLTLTLYSTGWWGSTSEHHTQGKLAGCLSFGHSGGVNKESERERNKSLILDLLKSVTVLQSSRIWKTVIHHCLGPVDSWLWPWAINSITDVLQQLRLNNYTEEEGTFSTPPGSLMRCYKYGWRMIRTLQKLIICRVKSGVWAVIVIERERQLGWLPCRAVTLNPSAVLNEYVHGCKKHTHTHTPVTTVTVSGIRQCARWFCDVNSCVGGGASPVVNHSFTREDGRYSRLWATWQGAERNAHEKKTPLNSFLLFILFHFP